MALTPTRVYETADATQRLAERLLDLFAELDSHLAFESDQAIAWTADPKPAYIDEQVDGVGAGNLVARSYTRGNIANLIGSMNAIRTLLNNGDLTGLRGDHLGNFNLVARPVGRR